MFTLVLFFRFQVKFIMINLNRCLLQCCTVHLIWYSFELNFCSHYGAKILGIKLVKSGVLVENLRNHRFYYQEEIRLLLQKTVKFLLVIERKIINIKNCYS